jgi:hypothetical protein
MDFGEVIGKAEAGELVYLTVVSGGQRRQSRGIMYVRRRSHRR